jgi:multiple antibiotic resistance protein
VDKAFDELVNAFVTLFVVVDPIGLAPLFLSLTRGIEPPARRKIAAQASAIALLVLLGAALFGDWLLRKLGIGLPAFRIAGGLLLFAIAFEMIFEHRQRRKATDAAIVPNAHAGLAAFPLAIPLMAGPAAITASLLLAGRTDGDPLRLIILLLVIGTVVLICLVVFLLASKSERLIGHTAQMVFTRLLGVLLAALAVQYVIDGALTISRQR